MAKAKKKNSIHRTAESQPTTEALQRGMCFVPIEKLSSLAADDLMNLGSAVRIVKDVLSGLSCQPRYIRGDCNQYNRAGELVEEIMEFFGLYGEAILRALESHKPVDGEDAEKKAFGILQYWSHAQDDLPSVSALAADLVRQKSHAEFHAGGGRK